MSNESGEKAAAILRAELRQRGVSYDELARRLEAAGYRTETGGIAKPGYLRKKVHLATFNAGFFLDVLAAVGATEIKL